jgi:hypothetical protein
MISYEQYCASVPYDNKILGVPADSDIKKVLLNIPFHNHHYIKYLHVVSGRSVSSIINELISNYVESCKK